MAVVAAAPWSGTLSCSAREWDAELARKLREAVEKPLLEWEGPAEAGAPSVPWWSWSC